MGNIGWSEILIIAVVIVFLFGPDKLPGFLKKFRAYRSALLKLRDEALKTVAPIEKEINGALLEDADEAKRKDEKGEQNKK